MFEILCWLAKILHQSVCGKIICMPEWRISSRIFLHFPTTFIWLSKFFTFKMLLVYGPARFFLFGSQALYEAWLSLTAKFSIGHRMNVVKWKFGLRSASHLVLCTWGYRGCFMLPRDWRLIMRLPWLVLNSEMDTRILSLMVLWCVLSSRMQF